MRYLTDDVVSGLSRASVTMGRDSGVRVVFKGKQAKTDGMVITLPSLPSGKTITQEQVSVIRGLSDHESGHIRHTDMHDYQRWSNSLRDGKPIKENQLLMTLNNCIEDVRIERPIKREYSGSVSNLNVKNSVYDREALEVWDKAEVEVDPSSVENFGPMSIKWTEHSADGISNGATLMSRLSQAIQDHAKNWHESVVMCRTSRDSQRLAEYIYDQIKDDPDLEQDPEPIPQDAIQNGEDGEPDTSQEQPNGKPEKGQGGHGEPMGEGEEGEGSEGHGGYGASEGEVKFSDGDPTKVIEQMFPPEPDNNNAYITPYTTEDDYWHTPKDSPSAQMMDRYQHAREHGMSSYNEALVNCSATTNILRNKVMRFLKTKELRDWDGGREVGRLDTRRLVSAYNGSSNVFKVKTDRSEIDTAISILGDLSGSMDGEKAYALRDCCVALAEALEPTMFKYTINGFSTYLGMHGWGESSEGENMRVGSLDMIGIKSWDQRLFEAKPYIGSIPQFVLADNNDPESILWCASDLKKRPEKKKVMIVLSDGHPATCINNQQGNALSSATKNAVRQCERDGIQMIGIGIMSDAVKLFYPNYHVVQDVSGLGDRVMDQILSLTK